MFNSNDVAEEQKVVPTKTFIVKPTYEAKQQRLVNNNELQLFSDEMRIRHLENQVDLWKTKFDQLYNEKQVQKGVQRDLKDQEIMLLRESYKREAIQYESQILQLRKIIDQLNLEITELKAQIQQQSLQIAELSRSTQMISELEQRNNELIKDTHDLMSENEWLTRRNQEFMLNIENAQTKLMHYEELKGLVSGYESQIEQLSQLRINYEQNFVKLKNADEQSKAKISGLEQELKFLKEQLAKKDDERQFKIDEIGKDHLNQLKHIEYLFQDQISIFTEQFDQLKVQANEYQRTIHNQANEIKNFKQTIVKYQQQEEQYILLIRELENNKQHLEQLIYDNKNNYARASGDLSSELFELREMFHIKNSAYQLKINEMNSQIQEMEAQIYKLSNDNDQLRRQNDQLQYLVRFDLFSQ